MAGRKVECVECGIRVRVPDGDSPVGGDDGLPAQEAVLFGLLFFLIPVANAVVSSVLYYTWRAQYPRRANQINLMGFLIFGLHVILGGVYLMVFKG